MKLQAFRYKFNYNKPICPPLAVTEKDGCFIIGTHDRGDNKDKSSYKLFQIAFTLDGTQEEKNACEIWIGNKKLEHYLDANIDIWYQKTIFTTRGRAIGGVDSVSRAGVFEVKVVEKGSGFVKISKKVEVLPSVIEKAEYQVMLDRLIELNEKFVVENSSVGIGGMKTDEKLWEELKPLLKRISSLPSDLLKKEHKKMPQEKLKGFDTHVLQSYEKTGNNYVEGIVYSGNYDTYENRVIKTLLMKLSQRNCTKPEEKIDIEKKVNEDVLKEFQYNTNEQSEIRDFDKSMTLYYKKKNDVNDKLRLYNQIRNEILSVLKGKWFAQIGTIPNLGSLIKATPKFYFNKYYNSIYKIMIQYLANHPLLTGDYENKIKGVKETWQIYEYWVLHEILNRFMNLNFKISYSNKSIREYLTKLIQSNEVKDGFSISLERKIDAYNKVEVLFGYNCQIGKNNGYYKPDYFIRITHADSYHWYFLDAKYKNYHKNDVECSFSTNIEREIKNVAINKYIIGMMEKECLDKKDIIKGAYLITANIAGEDNNMDYPLSCYDRLYGSTSLDSMPSGKHRYGAIKLTPSYGDELTTLLELIFEYKEAEAVTDFGKESGRPVHLNLCWNSTFDHKNIEPPKIYSYKTGGNNYKFKVSCQCGAERYETNCGGSVKHILIKHRKNGYHHRYWNHIKLRWDYQCPICGKHYDNSFNLSSAPRLLNIDINRMPSITTANILPFTIPSIDIQSGDDGAQLPF